MFYWLGLFIVEITLILLIRECASDKRRRTLLFFIIFCLVYFAGFRDGLGMDYSGYQELCERQTYHFESWILSEPLFVGLQTLCYKTRLSALFLFLISALISHTICLLVYSKQEYFALAAFVYIFYPELYWSSFNLVSQYLAASLFLLASLLLLKNQRVLFILLIFVAFLIHRSALLLLLVLFIKKDNFVPPIQTGIILFSLIVPFDKLVAWGYIGQLLNLLDYFNYLDYDSSAALGKFSLTNIYMHIIFFIVLFNKQSIMQLEDKETIIFSVHMMTIYLICNNLSANSLPVMYRVGGFFIVFAPIVFSCLPKIIDPYIARLLIIIPITFLISFMLISASGDRVRVPERILPLNSIVDENYHPYINPKTI